MTRRLFVDTTVLAYATGGEHHERQASRTILATAQTGEIELHVSVEAIQEFLFHRMRRDDRERALKLTRDALDVCVVHELNLEVMSHAIDLVASTPLRGRDAIHAATALAHGFTAIVSSDTDFDGLADLPRVAPAEALQT